MSAVFVDEFVVFFTVKDRLPVNAQNLALLKLVDMRMPEHLQQIATDQGLARHFEQLGHLHIDKGQNPIAVEQHNPAVQVLEYVFILVFDELGRLVCFDGLEQCLLKFTQQVWFPLYSNDPLA